MPVLTVVSWTAAGPETPPPETRCFTESGRALECVREGEGWTVSRLISTDLKDYLDPHFQPGAAYRPE